MAKLGRITLSSAIVDRMLQLLILIDTSNPWASKIFQGEMRALLTSKEERDKWQTKPPKRATGRAPRRSSAHGAILLPASSLEQVRTHTIVNKRLARKLARMLAQ